MNWDFEPSMYALAVCNNQAKIFEDIQDIYEKDAIDFITKFMQSEVAERMGIGITAFNNTGSKQLGEYFLSITNDILPLTQNRYIAALSWMGYMYRYWAWMGMPSKEIINIAPAEKAYMLYGGYHTLDIQEAVRLLIQRKQ